MYLGGWRRFHLPKCRLKVKHIGYGYMINDHDVLHKDHDDVLHKDHDQDRGLDVEQTVYFWNKRQKYVNPGLFPAFKHNSTTIWMLKDRSI